MCWGSLINTRLRVQPSWVDGHQYVVSLEWAASELMSELQSFNGNSEMQNCVVIGYYCHVCQNILKAVVCMLST